MIRHIFKQIWNERRQNGWVVVEYILIFIVLWFCADFLSFVTKRQLEPAGYDLKHVYLLQMGEKQQDKEGAETGLETEEGRIAHALTFIDRVKSFAGVEAVSLSRAAIPYGFQNNNCGLFVDDNQENVQFKQRWVTPGFFEVFKVDLLSGSAPAWPDPASEMTVMVSSDRAGNLGDKPVTEARMIVGGFDENAYKFPITGTVGVLKGTHIENLLPSLMFPLPQRDAYLPYLEITLRVSPDADHDFTERFAAQMPEQLNIGPYHFVSIKPMTQMKSLYEDLTGDTSQFNGVIAIVVFLVINIFLGIMGTFWFRTQSRRSEIGLRMALGSSRRKVMSLMMTETLLLLSLSVAVGLIVCLNIANTDLIEKFGMPGVYYQPGEMNIWLRGGLNFVLSCGFLALVSVLAVWYPARQASDTQPAEALRSE